VKKTIVLFSALLLTAGAALAQNISFGVKAAVTSNFLTYRYDNDDDDRFLIDKTGFYVGGIANIQLSEHFSLQPNLLLAMKGGKNGEGKISTFHIDVPVNLLYTTNGFFIGAGPNFSYGLSGKIEFDDEELDVYDQEEAGFSTLKRFEVGANCLMGYTLPNGLILSASFTPGLTDVFKGEEDSEENTVAHFKSFGLSIGYMFGKKK